MSNEYLDIAIEKVAKQEIDKVLGQIRAEIVEWRKEPARYIPNYDAYKRFLELIDKYMKGADK